MKIDPVEWLDVDVSLDGSLGFLCLELWSGFDDMVYSGANGWQFAEWLEETFLSSILEKCYD